MFRARRPVTALTDVDLLALERDEFISAVTGHPESAEAAHAAIANRLASLRPDVASLWPAQALTIPARAGPSRRPTTASADARLGE